VYKQYVVYLKALFYTLYIYTEGYGTPGGV